MREIFHFDSMLTPKIITFVYWLILFMVVVSGLGVAFSYGFNVMRIMYGLFGIVAGGVFARIWCELMIVLFKIHENIKKLAGNS